MARSFVLRQKTACARLADLPHDRLGRVDRQHQNFNPGKSVHQPFRHLETIELRHREIENRHIRPEILSQFDCHSAIRGFSHNFPFGMSPLQNSDEPLAHQLVIVGNQYPNAVHDKRYLSLA